LSIEAITNWTIGAGSVVLLGVIIVSWLLSYRIPKATPVDPGRKIFALPPGVQIGGGFIAIVLFAVFGYALWIPLPFSVSSGVSLALRAVGVVLFLAGLILVLWARRALSTMYGVSTTTAVQLQAQHRLVQHGPYAFIRHPMYLGYWLVLLGATSTYRTWAPLVFLVMLLPLYWRAQREEIALAAAFGAEWEAYAARTKFIIPFVRSPLPPRKDRGRVEEEDS